MDDDEPVDGPFLGSVGFATDGDAKEPYWTLRRETSAADFQTIGTHKSRYCDEWLVFLEDDRGGCMHLTSVATRGQCRRLLAVLTG